MRQRQVVTRSVRLLAAPLLLAGAAAGVAPAAASAGSAGRPGLAGPAAAFSVSGSLRGVAAVSAGDAWAVGYSGSLPGTKTLIVHWNGTAWK